MLLVKKQKLNEYLQKDVDKAIFIIKNQLEKRLGLKLVLVSEKGKFRKSKSGNFYGQKYQLMNRKQYIRFNWTDKTGGKIVSIDIFTKPLPYPQITIDFTNSIDMLNNIVDFLKGKISIEDIKNNEVASISIAEKEIPLETEIDMSFIGKDKEEIVFNQIVIRLSQLPLEKIKNFMSYTIYSGDGKTFDYDEFKRINKNRFSEYLRNYSNKNVMRFNDIYAKSVAIKGKEKIDNGIFSSGHRLYVGNNLFLNGRVEGNKKYYDWFTDYFVSKLDNIIKSNQNLLELASYMKLNIEDSNTIDLKPLNIIFPEEGNITQLSMFKEYILNYTKLPIKFKTEKDLKVLKSSSNTQSEEAFKDNIFLFETLFFLNMVGEKAVGSIREVCEKNNINLDFINKKYSEFTKKNKVTSSELSNYKDIIFRLNRLLNTNFSNESKNDFIQVLNKLSKQNLDEVYSILKVYYVHLRSGNERTFEKDIKPIIDSIKNIEENSNKKNLPLKKGAIFNGRFYNELYLFKGVIVEKPFEIEGYCQFTLKEDTKNLILIIQAKITSSSFNLGKSCLNNLKIGNKIEVIGSYENNSIIAVNIDLVDK